jgi:phage portal protein BeeE
MTYSNLVQVNTGFLMTTLMQYITPIENALSDLLPNRQQVRFKVEGLLRADEKTRAETYKIYKEMGVLSADEIRMKEGYGPQTAPVAQQVNA